MCEAMADEQLRRALKFVRYAHRLTLGELAAMAGISEIKLLSFETNGANAFSESEAVSLGEAVRLLLPEPQVLDSSSCP